MLLLVLGRVVVVGRVVVRFVFVLGRDTPPGRLVELLGRVVVEGRVVLGRVEVPGRLTFGLVVLPGRVVVVFGRDIVPCVLGRTEEPVWEELGRTVVGRATGRVVVPEVPGRTILLLGRLTLPLPGRMLVPGREVLGRTVFADGRWALLKFGRILGRKE